LSVSNAGLYWKKDLQHQQNEMRLCTGILDARQIW
jgi:hypothetical protein